MKINISDALVGHNIPQIRLLKNFYIFYYKKQLIFIKDTANLIAILLKLACIFVFLSQGNIAHSCFSFKR